MRMPKSAMVMAAGLGTRLRPLTLSVPKPMVRVQNLPLIDMTLDRLADAGVEKAVVNLHHLGHVIEEHLVGRQKPQVVFSKEEEILETGGGTKKALPLLGSDPFFTVNAKIIWLDGKIPTLRRLADFFDSDKMDVLLLLQPCVTAVGYNGMGDFFMDQNGLVRRRRSFEVAPFVYAGISICHPRLFIDAPEGAFSFNLLWDKAMEEGRFFGLRHDGEWYHVSALDQLQEVERRLAERQIRLRP